MGAPVLLVHDDIANIAAVRRLLTRDGYEVILATSAADALIAYGHHLPVLLVLAPGVESGRGHLVLEELLQHPDGKAARVLLLGESIPGFSAPVAQLPLEGAAFMELVDSLVRAPADADAWHVVENRELPASPGGSASPGGADVETWHATPPPAVAGDPALANALFGDLAPLHQTDWELAAMTDAERIAHEAEQQRELQGAPGVGAAVERPSLEVEAQEMAAPAQDDAADGWGEPTRSEDWGSAVGGEALHAEAERSEELDDAPAPPEEEAPPVGQLAWTEEPVAQPSLRTASLAPRLGDEGFFDVDTPAPSSGDALAEAEAELAAMRGERSFEPAGLEGSPWTELPPDPELEYAGRSLDSWDGAAASPGEALSSEPAQAKVPEPDVSDSDDSWGTEDALGGSAETPVPEDASGEQDAAAVSASNWELLEAELQATAAQAHADVSETSREEAPTASVGDDWFDTAEEPEPPAPASTAGEDWFDSEPEEAGSAASGAEPVESAAAAPQPGGFAVPALMAQWQAQQEEAERQLEEAHARVSAATSALEQETARRHELEQQLQVLQGRLAEEEEEHSREALLRAEAEAELEALRLRGASAASMDSAAQAVLSRIEQASGDVDALSALRAELESQISLRAEAETLAAEVEAQARQAEDARAEAELRAIDAEARAEAEAAAREAAELQAEASTLALKALEARLEAEAAGRVDSEARAESESKALELAERRVESSRALTVESVARIDEETRAREAAEARADAESTARLDAEARVRQLTQSLAEAEARAERSAQELAEAQALAEIESVARADAEARLESAATALAEAEARVQAEAEARADVEARLESAATALAEAQALVEIESAARVDAEARLESVATALAEAQARAEMGAATHADVEARLASAAAELAGAQARVELESAARADAEARAEAEALARAELEARLDIEAAARVEAVARAEAEAAARAEAEARAESEAATRVEAERRAEHVAHTSDDAVANAERESKARLDAEARAEREMEARAEAERRVEQEARLRAAMEVRAEGEATARANAEARAEREAQARAEAEARAEREAAARAEIEARVAAEANARAELEARVAAEADARAEAEARAEREAAVRAEAEARAAAEAARRAEAEARAEREAEARAAAETRAAEEARQRAEAEALAGKEAEQHAAEKARAEAEEAHRASTAAQAEAESLKRAELEARLEAEALKRSEAEAQAAEAVRQRAEAEARAEAAMKAVSEAQARADAEATCRAEAEAQAQQSAQAQAEAAARAKAESRHRTALEVRLDAEAQQRAALETKLEDESRARTESESRLLAENTRASDALAEVRLELQQVRETLEKERETRESVEQALASLREEKARIEAESAEQRERSERERLELEERALRDAEEAAAQARAALLPLEAPPGRPELAVARSGSVTQDGLTKLVLRLCEARMEMRVELKVMNALRVLWLRDGALVGAVSSAPGESLIDRARADGLIDARQEGELRLVRGATTAALLDALRGRGYLRESEAVPLVQRYTEQVFLDALAEPSTLYRLVAEPAPHEVALAAATRPPLHLLAEALRNTLTSESLLESAGSLRARVTRGDLHLAPDDFGLAPRDLQLLSQVDGEHTLEALLLGAGLPQDAALKSLAVARTLGLISLAPVGEEDEAGDLPPELDVRRLEAKFEEIQDADYFTVLGLARSAGGEEVKRAYELLSAEFHPLRFAGHPDPALLHRAQQIRSVLAEAAQALGDDRLRAEYARSLLD